MNEQAPHTDERLDALKTDTRILSAYVELVAENAKRLNSPRTDLGEQLHRIDGRLMTLEMHVNHGFDRLDQRFKHVDWRFGQLDWRFDQFDRRFDQLDRKSDQWEKSLSRVALELSRLSAAVSRLSAHLGIQATLSG
jgi:hypothetical protein